MQIIGKAKVRDNEFIFWNNGYVVDTNGNPIGTFEEKIDNIGNWDGTWSLYDTDDNFFGNLNAEDSTITNASGDVTDYIWTKSNSFDGKSNRNPKKLDTLYLGNNELQVMDNGGLYSNNQWVGFIEDGNDGGFNLKTTRGKDYCSIDKTGAITGSDDQAWSITARYGDYFRSPLANDEFSSDNDSEGEARGIQMIGTVTTFNEQGGSEVLQLGSDGGLYAKGGTSPLGTYSYGTTPNTMDIKSLNGNAIGTFDYAKGIFVGTSGVAVNAKYQGADPPPSTLPRTSTTTTNQNLSSRSSESSSSGFDWSGPVAGQIKQPLIDSALALPGLAKKAGTQAQEVYINAMEQAMGPAGFQGYLNSLAGDRMINSSIASGTLANAQQQAGQGIANQAFIASLAGTQAEMGIAGELARILSSTGTRRASSSSSGSSSSSNSQKTIANDPLAPYTAWTDRLSTA